MGGGGAGGWFCFLNRHSYNGERAGLICFLPSRSLSAFMVRCLALCAVSNAPNTISNMSDSAALTMAKEETTVRLKVAVFTLCRKIVK